MINRRVFLQATAAATVIGALPALAHQKGRASKWVEIARPDGGTSRGLLADNDHTPFPTLLVVPDRFGVNGRFHALGADLGRAGYLSLVADLYDGAIPTTKDEAATAVATLDPAVMATRLAQWIAWLKTYPQATGRVGVLAYGPMAGAALAAAAEAGADVAVLYEPTTLLAPVAKMPVLAHLPTEGGYDAAAQRKALEAVVEKGRLTIQEHAAAPDFTDFFRADYAQAADKAAWTATLAHLAQVLNPHVAPDDKH